MPESEDTPAVEPEAAPEAAPLVNEAVPCQSPPPTPRAVESIDHPRAELLRLADVLTRTRSRHVLTEYLRLRRALA
jgi:hypothetical protein